MRPLGLSLYKPSKAYQGYTLFSSMEDTYANLKNRWGQPRVSSTLTFGTTHSRHEKTPWFIARGLLILGPSTQCTQDVHKPF